MSFASSQTKSLSLDTPTLMAIGIVAFILANVLHEALGHGGGCLLVGGEPLALSSAHFRCGMEDVSLLGQRFVAAAGTLVNFIAAHLFWLAFRHTRLASSALRYFCWLALSSNFFVAAGYPLFSGVLGVGDWSAVTEGLHPSWLWRLLLIASGLALYALGVWVSLRAMTLLIGAHPTERRVRAFRLSLLPYLAGSLALTIGTLLNPLGPFVVGMTA
ncbi:MAG: hypothetical protein H0T73_10180, partial [Ardenticatenales bacterium]|nr:hypothetical protein [Ardenticatenales bacterium]